MSTQEIVCLVNVLIFFSVVQPVEVPGGPGTVLAALYKLWFCLGKRCEDQHSLILTPRLGKPVACVS